jgi:drug/metabolite transporter (DMT)-like permease
VRSTVAALLISAWCRPRGIALLKHDGTLWFGLLAGILFAVEFILIFQGPLYTTASRATLLIILRRFLWLTRNNLLATS